MSSTVFKTDCIINSQYAFSETHCLTKFYDRTSLLCRDGLSDVGSAILKMLTPTMWAWLKLEHLAKCSVSGALSTVHACIQTGKCQHFKRISAGSVKFQSSFRCRGKPACFLISISPSASHLLASIICTILTHCLKSMKTQEMHKIVQGATLSILFALHRISAANLVSRRSLIHS